MARFAFAVIAAAVSAFQNPPHRRLPAAPARAAPAGAWQMTAAPSPARARVAPRRAAITLEEETAPVKARAAPLVGFLALWRASRARFFSSFRNESTRAPVGTRSTRRSTCRTR